MKMQVLQAQLDNVSTQSTLLIGFALSMWAGETLVPLTEDQSAHCIYKTPVTEALGFAFFISVVLGVCFCSTVVGLSSYVKQRSLYEMVQGNSMEQSYNATVTHVATIYNRFLCSGMCFIASIILLFWIFVGTPNRIPYEVNDEDYDIYQRYQPDDDSVTQLHDGTWVITCIDKFSVAHNQRRDLFSYVLATSNTLVVIGMLAWGLAQFLRMRHTYDELSSGASSSSS